MGFTNTTYSQTTSSLIKGYQDRLSANPYYKFTDKKPTPVRYWNINSTMSTLDQATKQTYDQLGKEAPLRYNRINNFCLYGINRMNIDLQIGEYGPESSPIEGDAYILPNTVIPSADDYFAIDYLKGDDKYILFRITEANVDTLETGANFYRVHYLLDRTDTSEAYMMLKKQTVKTYEYIPSNVGTNFVALLSEDDKNSATRLSAILSTLRQYYIEMFYKKNIQTFVYSYADESILLYDPYMIEFLIRNKFLAGSDDDYMYISQATFRSNTFSIEYAKTLFKDVEDKNPEMHLNTVYIIPICDPNSLLVDRMEEYYELSVLKMNYDFMSPVNMLNLDFFDRIVNNNLYNEDDSSLPLYRNLVIGYMNSGTDYNITTEELTSLENINYKPTKDLYYELPLIMYTLNAYINNIMTTKNAEAEVTECNKCYVTRK
jgi:hypothetical protein